MNKQNANLQDSDQESNLEDENIAKFRGGFVILPNGTAIVSLNFNHAEAQDNIPLPSREESFDVTYDPININPQEREDVSDL
jgi:hypothetical protein